MKIRQGFVSNSSTSSFIVTIRDPLGSKGGNFKPLSKKKINLLKAHGFYPCSCSVPYHLESKTYESQILKSWEDDRKEIYSKLGKKGSKLKVDEMGYRVVCNQDIPLSFLVYNDIPFVASIHYNHYIYVYKEGWDYVIVLNNFGVQEHHDPENLFKNKKQKTVEGQIAYKVPKKEFIDEYDPKTIALDMQSSIY